MKIGRRLVLWYSGIVLLGLLLVSAWGYFEMVSVHPEVTQALASRGHTPLEEIVEALLIGGIPMLALSLSGGWFLMRRAMSPLSTLASEVERVTPDTLHHRLTRTGNGDELDRLAGVFNSMISRLADSFHHIRDFTLHASHELKTPLTVMRAMIESRLRDQPLMTSGDREFLQEQINEIDRLSRIADGLTFLAKADAGQVRMKREPVALHQLVRDSFADARILAGARDIKVTMEKCDELSIRGDRHRLRQLLLNLTDNAIKYNQPAGGIAISLRRESDRAELVISNTGPGIPPEKLQRVFERFYRCDAAHGDEVEGCGLGLCIAQWIVQAHGGMISIVSDPGVLTSVTVRFPLVVSPWNVIRSNAPAVLRAGALNSLAQSHAPR
jgi:signal transduction histidine kinase